MEKLLDFSQPFLLPFFMYLILRSVILDLFNRQLFDKTLRGVALKQNLLYELLTILNRFSGRRLLVRRGLLMFRIFLKNCFVGHQLILKFNVLASFLGRWNSY